MKKKITVSLALGIISALIVNEPFPSLLMGIQSSVVSFCVLCLFDKDEVEVLEEYKRDIEDPEEILP